MDQEKQWVRPQVSLADPKISSRADQAWEAIVEHGEFLHPERVVYLIGDRLVRVSKDGVETKLTPWEVTSLTDHLDRIADFGVLVNVAKDGEPDDWRFEVKRTPTDVASNLLHRTPDGLPRAPRITRVVDVPVVGSDKEIMFEPGYHPSAQTYYQPSEDLHLRDVTAHWTDPSALTAEDAAIHKFGWTTQQEDVEMARNLLISVFADFPFADTSSWTHAVAMMLEPFARELIGNKPTPMYAVSADLPNTGKSLLVSSALHPGCGERYGVMSYTPDTESMRKLLTSVLVQGGPAAWIDNVPKGATMDSHVLAACLTSPNGRWDDRILGHTKMASVPIRCVWVMTANKPSISAELSRRMIPIMLTTPHPDDYPFKLALDDDWLEKNRGELVAACLTLVSNYVRGSELHQSPEGEFSLGQPGEAKVRRSYRAWSRVMGGILAAAGIEGFLGNLGEWEKAVAVEVQDDAGLMKQWFKAGAPPLTSREVADLFSTGIRPGGGGILGSPFDLPISLQGKTDAQFPKAVSYWLRDTGPAGGYRILKHGDDSPHKWSVSET